MNPATSDRFEVTYLPGLEGFVHQELRTVLPRQARIAGVPGRDDAVSVSCRGDWAGLLGLRTAVAVFAVLTFPVPRPKSLTSGEYFPAIIAAISRVRGLNRRHPPRSFRFEAAGSGSAVFQNLAAQLAQATGLRHDPETGDVVLRFRRTPGTGPGDAGWDVLVRLTTRPLSDRMWRQANYPGAVNSTIAAAIAMATAPRPTDRVVNLMCGSGTLLIERLTQAPARVAVAVDSSAEAIAACRTNVAAAGVRVSIHQQDVAEAGWAQQGPFDVLLADPPWGQLIGERGAGPATHRLLLERAAAVAAPAARLVVLTHEITVMQACLHEQRDWHLETETRVFQKGHHPRIYLLRRQPER